MTIRNILITIAALAATVALMALFGTSLLPSNTTVGHAHTLVASSSTTASPTSSSTPAANSQSSSGINFADPAVIAAFIGAAGAIIVALISGAFVIYQTRKSQLANEPEKAATPRAKATRRRVGAYRDALRSDPRIANLQILDMSRPLEVTSVYVRLRLHREAKLSYELDAEFLAAEARHDPNELLRIGQKRLESHASTALDPDEAIRSYKHCVILGDPGAGKTTLLKYLAIKSAGKQITGLPDLPIHIELNDFAARASDDLLDFAAITWDERYGIPKTEARAYMEKNLDTGNALLLLDALDETVIGETVDAAEASYQRISNAIVQLATRYHQTPIVVTARKAGYNQRAHLVGFTELDVLDFRPEDIGQFVDKWFACYADPKKQANAADLKARLKRNPRIQALAANPLLLSLIVIVYEGQLDLPDRRAELYKQCVDTLLTKWDASRNIRRRREFKPEHKRQLLEEVAWHFHQQGRRYFPKDELLAEIARFLPAVGLKAEQNEAVLAEIAAENGLLKEQAQGWYGFLHLTLQEYFVAQHIADANALDTLLAHRGDPWWEEVILLYAGQTRDAGPLLQALLGKGTAGPAQEDIFLSDLLLVGRCLAARPTIRQAPLREEVTSRLFDTLTKTPYSLTRQQVAETLAEIGGTEVNTRLVGLLANQQINTDVRQSITEALGTLGERSIAPDLLRLLANPQIDEFVRWRIADALGILGERSVAPDLLRLLADPQIDEFVRERIADALGKLGERSVAPDLLRLLANPQIDQFVRRRIANALGELGERSVAPDLLRLLSDPQTDESVCEFIANALGKLGERSVAPDLLRLLANPQIDTDVRRHIANALGELGERSVALDLLRLLANPQIDTEVRRRIADALGILGERSVAPDLLRLLSDPQTDTDVRGRIAYTLGELGERSVAPDLLRLLVNPQINPDVRQSIAEALGELGECSITPDLLRLLANPQIDQGVHWRIAYTLGKLGERSVAPDLLRLLANPQTDRFIRERIADTLGRLADNETTVHELVELMQISDIADSIHSALWNVSRRTGVRVFMVDGPSGKEIKLVKWGS